MGNNYCGVCGSELGTAFNCPKGCGVSTFRLDVEKGEVIVKRCPYCDRALTYELHVSKGEQP